MKNLLILGAGGYGQLVKELAQIIGYEDIDFLDDNSPSAIGKLEEVDAVQEKYNAQIVAIGDSEVREKYFLKLKNPITLIHPRAIISQTAQIGKNVIIEPETVVNSNTEIKNGSFVCAGAVVNHNAVVGEFCQIDCNAVVGSFSVVDNHTKIVSCSLWKK